MARPSSARLTPARRNDGIGVARRFEQRDRLAELTDIGAHVLTETKADLDVASLVPALPSHVELELQRSFVCRVVEGGSPSTFECLDLADEDAVHLSPRTIERLDRVGIHPSILTLVVGPLIGEPFLGRDAMEPAVALQRGGWQLRAHPKSVDDIVRHRTGHDGGRACRLHVGTVLAPCAGRYGRCRDARRRGHERAARCHAASASPDVMLMCRASRGRRRFPIAHLPVGGPLLYDLWLRRNWPKVERATGPIDVAHATTLIPCASTRRSSSQCTTSRSSTIRRSSLDAATASSAGASKQIRRRADTRSVQQSDDDGRLRLRRHCRPIGFGSCHSESRRQGSIMWRWRGSPRCIVCRRAYLLFVGTVEPRKNLRGLVEAVSRLDDPLPLVVAGAQGWGDVAMPPDARRQVPRVRPGDRISAVCTRGAEVFCYPSEREGYGLPVLEAMAQGTPVVTSRGTATEETAGGAAVLVDPFDPDDIAKGNRRCSPLAASRSRPTGLARAEQATWRETARLTADGVPGVVLMVEAAIAVNLLWCVPGDVGGSEEYLVRQLLGLAEAITRVASDLVRRRRV